MIEKVECPYCSEVQNKNVYSENVALQCICIECENEFEIYKTKEKLFVDIQNNR